MIEHNFDGFKKILKLVVFTALILAGTYLVFRMSFYLAPFIIAFIISSLMEPLVRLFVKRARLKRHLAAALSLLLVLSTFGFLIFLLISKLISEVISIYNALPHFYAPIYNSINLIISKATALYYWLPPEVTQNLPNVTTDLAQSMVNILNSFAKGVLNTAISLPEALIFLLVTILSTYFLSSDRNKITSVFATHLPDSWIRKIKSIINDLFSALFGYIRAQLIMMCITFTELSIGFFIIGVRYFILLALVVSVIDALPILGTGSVLLPWAAFAFISGNSRTGISLLIIYAVVLIVRQMLEPKILSQQIGVHPLLTLMAMYAGLKLFGVGGLILGPITVLLLKNIFSGIFKNRTISEVLLKYNK